MATNFADPDCNMGPGCILWIICGWGQIVWDRRLNQGQGDPSKRCQSASIVHPSASLRLPSQSLCVSSADLGDGEDISRRNFQSEVRLAVRWRP